MAKSFLASYAGPHTKNYVLIISQMLNSVRVDHLMHFLSMSAVSASRCITTTTPKNTAVRRHVTANVSLVSVALLLLRQRLVVLSCLTCPLC